VNTTSKELHAAFLEWYPEAGRKFLKSRNLGAGIDPSVPDDFTGPPNADECFEDEGLVEEIAEGDEVDATKSWQDCIEISSAHVRNIF